MEHTAKEAAAITGRSVTFLRTHVCGWCGQSLLNAVRYGCGALACGPGPCGCEDCQPDSKPKPWWKTSTRSVAEGPEARRVNTEFSNPEQDGNG
jgi:hypothetical protein